ncbi:hypothetical protein [Streptomyces sp. NPDC002550]
MDIGADLAGCLRVGLATNPADFSHTPDPRTRPDQADARPGLRFGLIEHALAPLVDTLGADTAAMEQLNRDLAIVVSAEALFNLTDLYGLDPEDAIASVVHTATTLTRAVVQEHMAAGAQ